MTKDQLYKKIQALFPSELAVGDVVEHKEDGLLTLIEISHFNSFWQGRNNEGLLSEWLPVSSLKLKVKRISLSMVLEAMKKKKDLVKYSSRFGLTLCSDEVIDLLEKWQLRKDGKDLSLYDQSIETLEFILGVLK